MNPPEEWRDIPGYGGMYQISRFGEVRSWRRGKPHIMKTFKMHGKRNTKFVKLLDDEGKKHRVKVISLMVQVWKGGHRTGKIPYHINGDTDDHRASNIGFKTRQELGHMTGGKGNRRTVRKIDASGEVIAFYPSVRSAARENYVDESTVRRICRKITKNALEVYGCTFEYDD